MEHFTFGRNNGLRVSAPVLDVRRGQEWYPVRDAVYRTPAGALSAFRPAALTRTASTTAPRSSAGTSPHR